MHLEAMFGNQDGNTSCAAKNAEKLKEPCHIVLSRRLHTMASTELINDVMDGQQMQDQILEQLTDGVYFVDCNRRILYWNNAAEILTGYTKEQVLGTSCADGVLMHVSSDGNCLCQDGCPLEATMQDGNSREAHVFMHHAQGHRVPVCVRSSAIYGRDDRIIGSVEVFSDDTHRIQMLDRLREMEQAALVDELTGLANRRYFDRAMNASLAAYLRDGTEFGVLLIDVDHFKQFNDNYGHDVGDSVLKLVARTLGYNCRAYDTPARWGGEEFAVISEKITADALYAVAQRIRIMIERSSLRHAGKDLSITVSIGCSVVESGDDVKTVLRRADDRLYESKNGGRNRVTI